MMSKYLILTSVTKQWLHQFFLFFFQEDVFYIQSVDLADLTHCLIGHDSEVKGEGWFCSKVIVQEQGGEERTFYFPCNK